MKNCKICNKLIKSSLKKHENACSKINYDDVIFQYKNGEAPRNIAKKYDVGKNFIYQILRDKKMIRKISESLIIIHKKHPELFKHNDETKEKIRKKRIKWMKKNPDKTAWRQKNMSYPEQILWKELSKINEFIVEREKSFFPFFADFAILNANVVIEVDGSQHILEKNKIRDEKKDKIINDFGFRLIRFTAHEVQYKIENVMKKIKSFISKSTLIEKSQYVKPLSKKEIFAINVQQNKIKKEKEINVKIEKILKSDINFSKFGWVKKASLILEISSQKVGKWMKKNMNDFYNKKCFVKK